MKQRFLPLFCQAVLIVALGFSGHVGYAQKSEKPLSQKITAPSGIATSYYSVYIQQSKIGALTVERDDTTRRNNKPVVRLATRMNMDLTVLGTPTQIKSETVSWVEPGTGHPLAIESRTESAGSISTVTATFTKSSVSYVATVSGSQKKGTFTLKPGETFLADTSGGLASVPPIGTKMKGKVFIPEPAVLRLMDSEIVIVGKETISINGQVVSAYKVQDNNPMAPSTIWVDEVGDMLRTDTIMGMRVIKEPKAMALAPATKSADLLALVGIKATGEPLENPRALTLLRLEIANVSRPLPKDDNIQKVEEVPDSAGEKGKTVIVTITTRPLPTTPTVPLFKSVSDAPDNLKPFLQSTIYVQANSKTFQNLARKITGGETDAAKAAQKIAIYVHGLMKPDPSISNLRAASDLLKDPRGVCRDYTLLYTTIARAAGLPTKQCIGITYFNGSFLGHAWPEVWMGKDPMTGNDLWIALEPTWGAPFADAAHLKLAEGEISDFFNVAADMGQYTIKILEAK